MHPYERALKGASLTSVVGTVLLIGLLLGSIAAHAQTVPHVAVTFWDGQRQIATVVFEGLSLQGLLQVLRGRNFLLVFSGARLAEVRIYEKTNGEPKRIEAVTRRSDSPPVPLKATKLLSRRRDDPGRLTRLRIEALGNSDPTARSAALDALDDALAKSGEATRVVEIAVDVLKRDLDPLVVTTALRILGDYESVPLEPILNFAATTLDPSLETHALEVLSRRGEHDPRVRELLGNLASYARHADVRKAAENLLRGFE